MDPAIREEIYRLDLELQGRNINNQPEGAGVAYGWGTRRTK